MIGLIIISVLGLVTICFLLALYDDYHQQAKGDKRNKDLRNYWRDE